MRSPSKYWKAERTLQSTYQQKHSQQSNPWSDQWDNLDRAYASQHELNKAMDACVQRTRNRDAERKAKLAIKGAN
jgi:hypothetical protein